MQIAFMGSRIIGPAGRRDRGVHPGGVLRHRRDQLGVREPDRLGRDQAAGVAAAAGGAVEQPIHRIWTDMVAGWQFIVHHAAILFFVLAMAAGLFVIGCFGPLISIYVRDTLHASARAFGFVSGTSPRCSGTQIVRKREARIPTRPVGVVGIGAGVLLLGAVPHIAAALAATFTIGFAFGAILVPAQTLIQRETPHDMLGRVGSTNARSLSSDRSGWYSRPAGRTPRRAPGSSCAPFGGARRGGGVSGNTQVAQPGFPPGSRVGVELCAVAGLKGATAGSYSDLRATTGSTRAGLIAGAARETGDGDQRQRHCDEDERIACARREEHRREHARERERGDPAHRDADDCEAQPAP